jgi:hypothetical protein
MKRLTFVLAVALALGVETVAFAQARPDFSGTWRYNQGKSNPNTAARWLRVMNRDCVLVVTARLPSGSTHAVAECGSRYAW